MHSPAAYGSTAVPDCPFCPGQEHRTPPAVHQVLDDRGQWQIRVVPNKYPAVEMPFSDDSTGSLPRIDGSQNLDNESAPVTIAPAVRTVHATVPAAGVHEVVIESALHLDRMSNLTIEGLQRVLESYAARLRHWQNDRRLCYGLVFKNQGPRAGASLSHVHSQLVALPSVPPCVQAELQRAEQAYGDRRVCPYCWMVAQELSAATRLVCEQAGCVAFCPFASLQPYEVWLMPVAHQPSFEDLSASDFASLASVLHELLVRLEAVVPEAAYNMLLRTAPWDGRGEAWHHWRIECLPRSTSFAGLELAAGMFINPVAPERAAVKLRSN